MSNQKIPPLDLMFYLLETPGSPKHVGAVQIFRKPVGAGEDYMRKLVAAFKEAPVEAPFDHRPHFPRRGMPEWQLDEGLDIDYHVRHSALPQPGSDEQLFEVLSRLHCGLLSRDRPGWICQIIEGLEGDRFAIYSKIHHAYIDGMSGVKRLYGSLSTFPEDEEVRTTWSYVPEKSRRPRKQRSALEKLARARRSALAQLGSVVEIGGSFARMGMEMVAMGEGKAQRPFQAPRTRMNDRVEYDTRAIATCTLPLDRVREIAHRYDGKVNDVVLSVVDAALHDYLGEHGEAIGKPLVAYCPMSVREEGDDSASTQATALHIGMGKPDADPLARLQQVVASSHAAKEQARTMSREALVNMVMVTIGALEIVDRTNLKNYVAPSYNVLVSNVPGPGEKDFYLCGSRMESCFPISAFLPGGNLNVTVVSHGNQLDFGLVADKHALPDIHSVARRMEVRFQELEREVLGGPGRGPAGNAGSKSASRSKAKAKARTKAKSAPRSTAKASPKKKSAPRSKTRPRPKTKSARKAS